MLIRSRNRENGEMKVPTLALKSVAVLLLSSAMVVGSQEQPASSVPKVQPSPEQPATEAPQTGSQPAQTEPQSAAPLRVMVGKSLLLNTRERIKRISVTDAAIADPLVVAPTQILVHGRSPGEVSLLIWDELERSRSFDLRVDVDVSAVAEEEKRVFPDEQIAVTPSRSAIVLSGHVSTEDVAKRAGMIADAYSKNVVNVLTFGPVGAQEILLEVKFAEVDRTAVTQLGINLFAPGLGNTIAQTQTGQFGTITTTHPAPTIVTTPTGTTTTSTPSTVNISDFLNVFVPRTDVKPDRGQWQGSKLSGRRGISLPRGTTWQRSKRDNHSIQGIRRPPEIHSCDHAEREHTLESDSRSQHLGFRQWAYHFRLQRARAEHPEGGH